MRELSVRQPVHRLDRYDSLIAHHADEYKVDARIIKRQMLAESTARPDVVSPVGAVGLMQFMPATWKQYGRGDPTNPEQSIKAGCAYMAWLFSRYGEIPDETERWRFTLAAYNAGRGNVNRMLAIARDECGQPASYREWEVEGRPEGPWQTWRYASQFLHRVTGHHSRETLSYVDKIMPYEEPEAA